MTAVPRPGLPLRWNGVAQPVLVGRRRELAVLEEVWSAVLLGARQVVVVGGEPGAGKSRLLAEQCTTLHGLGACVLVGSCVPDLGLPYQPFTEPAEVLLEGLRPAEGSDGGVDDGDAERLRVVAGRTTDRTRPDEPEHRRQLYDSVVVALATLCREQPVVLALEDLHWAGPPALELLTYLVERLPESRLLVLATHRTTAPDRSAGLLDAVSRLSRLDGVRRLDLEGLRPKDITDYLQREAGLSAEQADGPAAVLHAQTGGNPFFLRELWRDLSARGGVTALGAGQPRAPLSVRDALQSRLRSLPEPQRQSLELAAVVGEECDVQTVLAASEWSRDTTLLALDDGVAHGLLTCLATGRYRFVHALARQAVLELLPPARRAQQHARVAGVIEARPAGSAARIQALAHHYAQAHALGFADKAVDYLTQAARSAGRALAHEAAARCYEQAAELVEGDGPRAALHLSAARSHLLGGDFARARSLAEPVACAAGAADRLQAAVLYEAASWRPGLPGHRAVELLTGALAAETTDADDHLRIRAQASLGRARAFIGDTGAARELGTASIDLARRSGDDGLLAHALQASLWQGLRPQDVPDKLARATELSVLAHRTGDLGHLGPAAYYRGVISYLRGDAAGWSSAQQDLILMSHGTGQGFFEYMAGCLEYGHQFVTGQFAAAGRTCQALLELGDQFGTDGTEGPTAVQTFMLRRESGAVRQVRPFITGQEDPTAVWAPGLLALYTALGMDEPAGRLLAWLLDDRLAHHRESAQWPAVLAFMVEAAVQAQDPVAARQLRPDLQEYAGHNLVAGQFVALFGSADRYLGSIDSLLGRVGAEDLFAAALELDTQTGAPVHEAHTLAALYAHRRRSGATPSALAALADRTRALAEPLGLVGPLRVVGHAPVRVPPQRPDGLTAREADVLRLLGEGLANRDIAERLTISEHTAANHVRSILAKTGSANRTQAAMYAAGHDLLQ